MESKCYARIYLQLKVRPVLVDNAAIIVNEVTGLSPKVVGEFMKELFQPAGHLGKAMNTKAYPMFVEHPWRRFVLGLSIVNKDLCLHFYDHTGGAIFPHSTFMNTPIVSSTFSLHWLLTITVVLALICQSKFLPHLPYIMATYAF